MACAPNRNRQGNIRPQRPQTNGQSQTLEPKSSLKGNGSTQFKLEAWADNWFAAYLDNQLIIEDSVPITTERSFNSETAIFTADYHCSQILSSRISSKTIPVWNTLASADSRWAIGGFIMQLTDMNTGDIVSVSDQTMKCTVIHKASLNRSCERSPSPIAGKAPCGSVSH